MNSSMMMSRKRKLTSTSENSDLFSSQLSRSQSQHSQRIRCDDNILKDDSVFGELVAAAGFVLRSGDQPNGMKCDQAVFQRNLRRSLKLHPLYRLPEIAIKFKEGLDKHLDDPLRLKWALLYTQTEGDCETARGGQQDSLMRLCLNIDELQAPLISLLAERLLLLAHSDDEDKKQANIASLILANLKWLVHITEPDILTSSIIDMIKSSPIKMQQEVISFVPNIIDDSNHPKIATILCDLYESTPELTPAILDALSQLSLHTTNLEDVHHSVLKSLQATQPTHLLGVIKFLLTGTQQATANQVISDMREKINLPGEYRSTQTQRKGAHSSSQASCMNDDEAGNIEVLIINTIKTSALCRRFLTTAWLKAIQDVSNSESVKALDFLLLVQLFDAVPSQCHPIMSIIRNKIRAGLFAESMFTNTFTKHTAVLKEHIEPVKKIASLLLCSSEPLITQAGVTIYRLSFMHLGPYAQQEVILALLHHLGVAGGARGAALSLLTHLTHNHTQAIASFTVFIKGSLDCFEDLTTGEMRRVLEMVTCLVFSTNSHAALQEELFILLRKQLSHKDAKYKHIGVLSAAFVLKNMVPVDAEQSTMTHTSSETGDRANSPLLNTTALQEAENLLHMVLTSTREYPTALALFLDELASITLKDGLNFRIQEYLCDKMTSEFQENFIVDYTSDTNISSDTTLPLDARWTITEPGDSETEGIAVNLGLQVLKNKISEEGVTPQKTQLVCMTPQFRLLRMIESSLHEGDLSNIDALLACPVYAPTQDILDTFESLTTQQQHLALSCLFYTVNWFRELVNAFVTQKQHKSMVYRRLEHVLSIEGMLRKLVPLCPSYMPPPATFHLDSPSALNLSFTSSVKKKRAQKQSKGKKGKGKDGETNGLEGTQLETQMASQMATPTTQAPSQSHQNKSEDKGTLDSACLRPFLRELHIDVFSLLFKKLALLTDMSSDNQLTISQAEFLLTDLNFKLTNFFTNKRPTHLATDKSVGCSYLLLFSPREVAQRVHMFLKPVCTHLEQISAFFQTLIADNDGVMDGDNIFSEHTQPIISLNKHLFTTLSLFMSWPGLQQEENHDILQDILRTIAKKLEGDRVKSMSTEELTWAVCGYLCNFQPSVVNMSTAATLVTTLTALIALPNDQDLATPIVNTIEEILKREWYTTKCVLDRGAAFNQHINTLLKEYLRLSEKPLKKLETLCNVALKEFLDTNSASDTYPTLNKNTLGIYYRAILSSLVTSTRKALSKVPNAAENKYTRLLIWDSAIKVLHFSINLLKTHNTNTILISCLRFSRQFIEMFIRSGMPLLDACLRLHNEEVVTLLRSLQSSTRFLQHVCTHSKVRQDTSLTSHVPPLKKCLETLVYRVKQMLSLNNCANAFWMGVLKNRDLQGQEIMSQRQREESDEEDEEEEEEEMEACNEESDVELEDDDENRKNRANDDDRSTDLSSSF